MSMMILKRYQGHMHFFDDFVQMLDEYIETRLDKAINDMTNNNPITKE